MTERQCPKCGGHRGYTSSHGWLCFSCPTPKPTGRVCAECGVTVCSGDGGVRAFGRLFCSDICADIQDPAFNDIPTFDDAPLPISEISVGREAGTATADDRREPEGERAADLSPIPGHDRNYARAGWREAIRLEAQKAERLTRENERLREALENAREALLNEDEPTAIRWLIEGALLRDGR